MYYTDEATQAEVADHLQTSRATVSRLLEEARRQGIVRIEVFHGQRGRARSWCSGRRRPGADCCLYLRTAAVAPRGQAVEDLMGGPLSVRSGVPCFGGV